MRKQIPRGRVRAEIGFEGVQTSQQKSWGNTRQAFKKQPLNERMNDCMNGT